MTAHRPPEPPEPPDAAFVEVPSGDVVWRFERAFMTSRWRCRFGDGCHGILPERAAELGQGCCSLGAHFGDGEPGQEEARTLSAYVALLTPERWQHHDVGTTDHAPPPADDEPAPTDPAMGAAVDRNPPDADPGAPAPDGPRTVAGFYGDAGRTRTRVVDGACVFLNRPGFEGGEGCALHLAALDAGESPIDWKPSVCWQLPLRVDWALLDDADPDGPETATVRRWSRADWGEQGRVMAWCCTERDDGGEAFSGDAPVVDSLADELVALAGHEVHVELRRRLP